MPHINGTSPDKLFVKKRVLELLSEETREDYTELAKQVDVDISTDTAVDSVAMAGVVAKLEEEFSITVEDGDIIPEKLRSLEEFTNMIIEKTKARATGMTPQRPAQET